MAQNKRLIFIISVVAAVCLAVTGVTIAFYQAQTEEVNNTFRLGEVDVSVPEEFPSIDPGTDEALKAVYLENTGTVDAYLRGMIVPTFRGEDGSMACDVDYSKVLSDGYILVTAPNGSPETYRLDLAPGWQSSWHFSPAGNVFYYRKIVPHTNGTMTTMLLKSVTKSGDNWKNLNIDILADAIQTQGDNAREHLYNVWGVTGIDPDGTLHWD